MGDLVVIEEWLRKKALQADFDRYEAIKSELCYKMEQESGECFCYGG